MNDLSQEMQSRLDAWRKRTADGPSAQKVKGKSPGNFIQRQRDYGDDIRDYLQKDQNEWSKALQNDPAYRNYR